MATLIRLTAFLIMLFIVIIGGSRLFGPSQHNMPFATWFTNPDYTACQQPCLFGVRPGVSTLDHALAALITHPVTRRMVALGELNGNRIAFRDASSALLIAQRTNSVLSIYMQPWPPIPLYEVIAVLGIPDGIILGNGSSDGEFIELLYMTQHLQISCVRAPDRLTFNDDCTAIQSRVQLPSATTRWMGFSSVQHYFAALGSR